MHFEAVCVGLSRLATWLRCHGEGADEFGPRHLIDRGEADVDSSPVAALQPEGKRLADWFGALLSAAVENLRPIALRARSDEVACAAASKSASG